MKIFFPKQYIIICSLVVFVVVVIVTANEL